MADRKRRLKRRDKRSDSDGKPSKQEYAVAKYLRFKCPSKSSLLYGDEVHYFTGSKAVDVLLDSPWATCKKELLFTNRHSCVDYLQDLLNKGFFFRARKLIPKRRDRSDLKDLAKEKSIGRVSKCKTEAANDERVESRADVTIVDPAKKSTESPDKKKHKKIKLDVHSDQIFVDGNDVYAWKYNPTAPKTFLVGLLMVIGSIVVCLFPLWPAQFRLGVYYASILAMCFVGCLIALVCIRTVLFCAIWLATFGKHHFWLLPNLTEDCGFFDSFKPLYLHSVHDVSGKKQKPEDNLDSDEEDEEDSRNGEQSDRSSKCADKNNFVVNVFLIVAAKEGLSATDVSTDEEREKMSDSGGTRAVSEVSSASTGCPHSTSTDFEFVEKPLES
ncbi:translocation protein Sec62 [Trichuris suis]|nr:translocation protein Sec62 [Trichuris suis]